MSGNDKWVRRFSVDETAHHKNGFTIYKITSVLFPLDSPSAVTVVSVWKRYREVRALHAGLKSLHSALHLQGAFPELTKNSWDYFKRFNQDVIEARAESIKNLLEFVALHPLLFTSIQFVNFLQNGHPSPGKTSQIKEICDELRLPKDDILLPTPNTDSEDSPTQINNNNISNIEIFEGVDFDRQRSNSPDSPANSFRSLNSLESIDSDTYDEVSKLAIEKTNASVKPKMLPDLINFDQPSTSFQSSNQNAMYLLSKNQSILSNCDQNTHDEVDIENSNSINVSTYDENDIPRSLDCDQNETRSHISVLSRDQNDQNSNHDETDFSSERIINDQIVGIHSSDQNSRSSMVDRNQTEDSYIFEAGYLLNLAARCEQSGDYSRSFQYYKSGIEKLLIGVKSDNDAQRRVLVKEKIQKYLSYAEQIYINHLHEQDEPMSLVCEAGRAMTLPVSMLQLEYNSLSQYNVISVINCTLLLVREHRRGCLVIKVIQKIPINLTEFDDYIQRKMDYKQPVLPTNIPYMVPLYNYIENENYIFLILHYAPGNRLLDYMKKYVRSMPSTPSREVNLENVFCEPKCEMSVGDIVRNSQKLLSDVDSVLNDQKVQEDPQVVQTVEAPINNYRGHIPNSTICTWSAQLLLCLEHLHSAGVICRDLNPSNILLGQKGQIIVTYQLGYSNYESVLTKLERSRRSEHNFYIAPELYRNIFYDSDVSELDHVCDFWSFGAILYELICGVPLSTYHRSEFTTHTLLQFPDELPLRLEETSILTQLLTYEPSERLGAGEEGMQQIKSHPYYKNINWKSVYDEWIMPSD